MAIESTICATVPSSLVQRTHMQSEYNPSLLSLGQATGSLSLVDTPFRTFPLPFFKVVPGILEFNT